MSSPVPTLPPSAAPVRSPATLTGSFGARARYLLESAVRNMAQAPLVTALTIATIGITLFVFGLFALGTLNLARAVSGWGRGLTVIVELKEGAPASSGEAVVAMANAGAWTQAARVVPREEALERLRRDLGGRAADLLAGLAPEDNPLGDQVEIELGPARAASGGALGAANPGALPGPADLEALVAHIRAQSDVVAVEYGAEVVAGLQALLRALRASAVVLAIVLFCATVFVVANTIKLTVLARRDEIEIMKLVGATDAFVRVPFLIEGAVQGALGGAVAMAGLGAAFHYGAPLAARGLAAVTGPFEPAFLPTPACLAIAGAGLVLGFVGSLTSVGRHLRS